MEMSESSPKGAGTRVGGEGRFLSKARLIFLAVVIITLIIVVVVLAIFLGIAKARLQKGEEQKDKEPTYSPTTPHTTHVAPTTPGTEAWWHYRLPKSVVPSHYNIFLNITVDQPRFDGSVDIEVEVQNKTDLILLHNNGLNVTWLKIQSLAKKDDFPVKKHFTFKKYMFEVIQMETELEPGRYSIDLKFEGFFSIPMDGMYRRSFITRLDERKVNYAATQFEATSARKAFPCFDEPALKATFNVTIAHRSDYVAICNMPIYKTETLRGQTLDYYSMTPVVMPTYLLAFVVGDFKFREENSSSNVSMRYYSRPSFLHKLQFALTAGRKIMTFFEKHFGIKYSLPKADMAAIPAFGPGAMENWGLILYRENLLLWDANESTVEEKQTVASVITHELAHMWFGNIVTMEWWNDLWLNEGFAKFYEYSGKAAAEPAWNSQDDMVWTIMSRSMKYDGHVHSNPIRPDADKSTEMSPTIYYNKAACILRMAQAFLGNETFLNGLKIYLKRHAFRNVVSDDLWKALREASCTSGPCFNVKQILDTWILQMGYPVVDVKRKNATHYTLSQSRFLFDKTENTTDTKYNSPFGYSWIIPLTYSTDTQPDNHSVWMNMSSATIEWDGNGWFKANTDYKGFFITNYEDNNWKALAKQLKIDHTVFSPSDRGGLLMDASYLANGEKLNYSTSLSLTEYMTNETEYLPWKILFQQVDYLQDILPRTSKAYKYLMKYLVFLGKKEYDRLGFQDMGGMIDKYARTDFLKVFCAAQIKSCVQKATEMFRAWMDNPAGNAVPPNLRTVVYYHGVEQGGVEEWDFLYSQYNKTQDASNRRRLLYGMAASKEPWVLERYLSYTLMPRRLHKNDMFTVIWYVANVNPFGSQLAWSFVRANWARLVSKYGSPMRAYSIYVPRIVAKFNSQFGLSEVERFHQKLSASTGVKISNGVESGIKRRIKWLENNEQDIEYELKRLFQKKKKKKQFFV